VRSASKADRIRNHKLILESILPSESLQFVVVPDLAAPGAFDEAVQGVSYIIHTASPVPAFGARDEVSEENLAKAFVEDAVQSNLSILESASKAGDKSVKRVVLTSSAVAIIPFANLASSPDADYTTRFGPESRLPTPSGPFGSEIEAYAAGKVASLNAAEQWVVENKSKGLHFDLVPVLPSWAFGRNELAETADDLKYGGSNSVLLGLLLGNQNSWPSHGNAALVTDVAKVHVLALDPKVEGGTALITSRSLVWEDALSVLKTEFSDDVAAGRLSAEGKQPTQQLTIDGSATEDILGIKFSPYEDLVRQVAGQYVELVAA
jgi:nucleoside-diphosphate-sugar epimerase